MLTLPTPSARVWKSVCLKTDCNTKRMHSAHLILKDKYVRGQLGQYMQIYHFSYCNYGPGVIFLNIDENMAKTPTIAGFSPMFLING